MSTVEDRGRVAAALGQRWWTSPDAGLRVLRAVSQHPGEDVAQAVGTAVLGYHALALAELAPLGQRTLVDSAALSRALGQVELDPVAKALTAATQPVMGAAAPAYGELLAKDLHDRAAEAADRLIHTWTTSGMPWPLAITRAADVHGVPLTRLGRYASQLKVTALPPMVLADAADRVLMGYAAELGERETSPVQDIAKSMASAEFDPDEHPRDGTGRFRSAVGRDPVVAARARMRERTRGRRQAASTAVEQRAADAAEQASARQDDLGALLAAAPRQRAVRERATRERAGRVQATREQLLRTPAARRQQAEEPPAAQAAATRQVHFSTEEILIPVRGKDLEKIFTPGGARFQIGAMRNILGGEDLTGFSPDQVTEQFGGPAGQLALHDTIFLRVRWGAPIVDGGPDDALGAVLAHDARFEVNATPDFMTISGPAPYPGAPESIGGTAVVYDLTLTNEDQLRGVSKADFIPDEHPRAGDGRFRAAAGQGQDVPDIAAARARMRGRTARRRQQVVATREQLVQARTVEAEALAELLHLRRDATHERALRSTAARPRAARPRRARDRVVRERLNRLYPRDQTAADAHGGAINFAATHAFVLNEQEFGHLFGLHPDELSRVDDLVTVSPVTMQQLLYDTATDTLMEADDALALIQRRAAAERADTGEYVVRGGALHPSEDGALDDAEHYAYLERRDDTGVTWTAGVEPVHTDAGVRFRAVVTGVRAAEIPILVLGSVESVESVRHGMPVELERVDADDLVDLVSLRSDDDAPAGLEWTGARDNPPLRVYRVRSRDDETT